jgi:hypothetical protein
MKKETANLFGREIPLTKSGNINKTFLTKEEKNLLEGFEADQKNAKKEVKLKELQDFFNKKK